MGIPKKRTPQQSSTHQRRPGRWQHRIGQQTDEHKRQRTRQTHINMHRGDQLGERQDRRTGTEMDATEVPLGDRVPEGEEQGNNPTEQLKYKI